MRLILHIGTHKTGTTSIQKFLSAHHEELARRGVWYPGYDIIGERPHYAHLHFAHGLAEQKSSRIDLSMAQQFAREVALRACDYDLTIISAEPFYRHRLPAVPHSDATYVQARRRYIDRVREAFSAFDVELAVVLRRQDQFAQSLYNEHVKVTSYRESFLSFVDQRRPLFDYLSQIGLWEEKFPDISLQIFEDLVQSEHGLVKGFLNYFGVRADDLAQPALENESLPLPLLAYKRALNKSTLDRDQLANLSQLLSQSAISNRLKESGQRLSWMSNDEAVQFQAAFERDNQVVKDRYTNLQRPTLFSLEEKQTIPFSGLSEHEFLSITAEFLTWIAE